MQILREEKYLIKNIPETLYGLYIIMYYYSLLNLIEDFENINGNIKKKKFKNYKFDFVHILQSGGRLIFDFRLEYIFWEPLVENVIGSRFDGRPTIRCGNRESD